jgi:UrcA family protein
MNRFTTVIAILTVALIQQTAQASVRSDELPTSTVRFADLDLDHTPGAAVMYRRLKQAAEQVCSPLKGADLGSKARFGRCTEEAVAAAIAKIGRPILTQYYRSVTHDRNATVLLAKQ